MLARYLTTFAGDTWILNVVRKILKPWDRKVHGSSSGGCMKEKQRPLFLGPHTSDMGTQKLTSGRKQKPGFS